MMKKKAPPIIYIQKH